MADPSSIAAAYPSPPNYTSPPAQRPSLGSLYERVAMSSSLSPDAYGKQSASGANYGNSGSGSGSDKSPLSSMNLGFLKSLTEKKITRDGNPPKRRGPKPDSKPALTRRQELNRQAQRTHRERKELYIKALEDEVLRLKEIFSNMSQDKDKLAEENKQLKSALQQSGIPWSSTSGQEDMTSNPSVGYTSSASVSGSYHPHSHNAFTPPLTSQSTAPSMSPSSQAPPATTPVLGSGQPVRNAPIQVNRSFDQEQAGIDFVLTYDNPSKAYLSPPPQ